jgi:hypothetical protein
LAFRRFLPDSSWNIAIGNQDQKADEEARRAASGPGRSSQEDDNSVNGPTQPAGNQDHLETVAKRSVRFIDQACPGGDSKFRVRPKFQIAKMP